MVCSAIALRLFDSSAIKYHGKVIIQLEAKEKNGRLVMVEKKKKKKKKKKKAIDNGKSAFDSA